MGGLEKKYAQLNGKEMTMKSIIEVEKGGEKKAYDFHQLQRRIERSIPEKGKISRVN